MTTHEGNMEQTQSSVMSKKTKKIKVRKKRNPKKIIIGIIVGTIAFLFSVFYIFQIALAYNQNQKYEEIRSIFESGE